MALKPGATQHDISFFKTLRIQKDMVYYKTPFLSSNIIFPLCSQSHDIFKTQGQLVLEDFPLLDPTILGLNGV